MFKIQQKHHVNWHDQIRAAPGHHVYIFVQTEPELSGINALEYFVHKLQERMKIKNLHFVRILFWPGIVSEYFGDMMHIGMRRGTILKFDLNMGLKHSGSNMDLKNKTINYKDPPT